MLDSTWREILEVTLFPLRELAWEVRESIGRRGGGTAHVQLHECVLHPHALALELLYASRLDPTTRPTPNPHADPKRNLRLSPGERMQDGLRELGMPRS
jgi:hypothetical protein